MTFAESPITILDSLFPAGVVTILSLAPDPAAVLGPGESACAERFVASRLAEFRHGRTCARQALARLGTAAADIPVGRHREPIWPAGVVGSISHEGEIAAAAVAWESEFLSLGLDLAGACELEADLIAKICRPEETERISNTTDGAGYAAKLLFAIKEAAYKALWPAVRQVLDFQDLEIRLEGSRFAVISRSEQCPAGVAARLIGQHARFGDVLAACAALPTR